MQIFWHFQHFQHITEPSLAEQEELSDEESDFELEYEILSAGSAEPWDDSDIGGAFEVQKSGRALDLCDGTQAHLSSCASPKVLDTINRFPQKVLFNEVSRLSTWPIQFQECGVKEDNIALFFFAKDIRSYERCYKTMLENMIRNDMALRANLEGVELLIFPSNRLPEKSQRTDIVLFHGKNGKIVGNVDTNQLKNNMATISPNGRFIAAAAFTADVKVWEIVYSKDGAVKEVSKVMELKGHKVVQENHGMIYTARLMARKAIKCIKVKKRKSGLDALLNLERITSLRMPAAEPDGEHTVRVKQKKIKKIGMYRSTR